MHVITLELFKKHADDAVLEHAVGRYGSYTTSYTSTIIQINGSTRSSCGTQ